MNSDQKKEIIDNLAQKVEARKHFYIADIGGLNAAKTSELRRKCFEKDIELVVVKNTLLRKALERYEGRYDELFGTLSNSTSVMFTETANAPAKLIKEFRKDSDKPIIKGAYVEESIFIGDVVDTLASLKSKEELIGEVIGMLQSPAQNVVSALQSGKNTLAGVVKTLSERE